MITALTVLGVVWLVFLGIFVVEVLRAPVGYEDRDGFHYSNSPKLPAVVRKPATRRPSVKRTLAKG